GTLPADRLPFRRDGGLRRPRGGARARKARPGQRAPDHESAWGALADPAPQRRNRFAGGSGCGKARHSPLHEAAGDLVSASTAGLDLDRARDGARRDTARARPLTWTLLSPQADARNGEPGGEHPP